MSNTGTIISKETIVEGEIEAREGTIDVFGTVNGKLNTSRLVIHPEGKVVGNVDAVDILANGLLQGEVRARGLIDIGTTGSVNGDIRYGKLAMKEGGELSADLKNIPPTLGGDLKLAVARGKAVRLTTNDLTAFDPDDKPSDLTFNVSEMKNGFVVSLANPKVPANHFTQEELEKGTIVFVHDGKESKSASFRVSVTDKAGASSGAPRTVEVEVRG